MFYGYADEFKIFGRSPDRLARAVGLRMLWAGIAPGIVKAGNFIESELTVSPDRRRYFCGITRLCWLRPTIDMGLRRWAPDGGRQCAYDLV